MNELYSNESEVELLGAMLKDNEVIPEVIETLSVDDFYVPKNKLIYSKATALYKESKAVDAITVYEAMSSTEVSLSDLLALSKISASPNAHQTYSMIVKDFSNKRKLRDLCERTLAEIATRPADKTASLLSGEIYKMSEEKIKQTTKSDMELMTEAMEYIAKAKETKGQSVGMRTGWKMLDMATNGIEKGSLNIIAARPAAGKTSVMLALAERFASKGYKCLIFEQEMTETSLALRRLAAKSNTSFQKIKKGSITDEEFAVILHKADMLAENNRIFTDCSPAISLTEIRNRVRKIKQTHGLDIVFVDHIGLMKSEEKAESRTREISIFSKGLKAIAAEYQVAMIVLSQLNREVEKRLSKRPMLSDLSESGSLEQDSDIVIGLYRESYYDQEKKDIQQKGVEEMEFILLKNRDGASGTITMHFDARTQLITEPELHQVGSRG